MDSDQPGEAFDEMYGDDPMAPIPLHPDLKTMLDDLDKALDGLTGEERKAAARNWDVSEARSRMSKEGKAPQTKPSL